MTTVKVLFSGACEGSLGDLFKKVDAVNKKNGPFNVMFCVGQLFGKGDDSADPSTDTASYVTDTSKVPVETYFIGGCGQGSSALLPALPSSGGKLNYLGRSGVAQVHGLTVAYLDGTFNSAAYQQVPPEEGEAPGCRHYTELDVQKLKMLLKTLEGDVDVLLTSEWPRGIGQGTPEGAGLPAGINASTSGSTVVAEIAELARPRYHIAGGEVMHYARLPYANRDLGAGIRVTRFIGLAPVNNAGKQKSLHALNLVPAGELDPEQLSQRPEGCTASPFEAGRGSKRSAMDQDQELPDQQDWRWQMKKPRGPGQGQGQGPQPILGNPDIPRDPTCTVIARNVAFRASEGDIASFFSQAGKVVNIVRSLNHEGKLNSWMQVQFDCKDAAERALQLHGLELMGRTIAVEPPRSMQQRQQRQQGPPPGQPQEGCWFCLGSSNVDINLVASVGVDSYLALDKGAITGEHVLVVPIDHHPSSLALPDKTYLEMDRYLSALRSCFASQGMELVAFERFLALRKAGGNHCHVNAIGVPSAAGKRARAAFEQAASAVGFELTHLPAPAPGEDKRAAVREVVGDNEYFLAMLPDGSRLVRSIERGERFPMALGREVLADLVGHPELADWKATSITPEEEEARTATFKKLFGPYDIMQ